MPALPRGTILLWSGSIVSIPGGFALCDGTLGTPDLRNRFVVGAGGAYAVGANGGAINHNHSFTGDGHLHLLPGGTALGIGLDFAGDTTDDPATGTTDNADHLPPYYALAYIMKT